MGAPLDVDKLRKRVMSIKASLMDDRNDWQALWTELRDYFSPYRGRNITGAESGELTNAGLKRLEKIWDCTHLRNVSNAAAGMHSGLTSPNRPWFKLSFGNDEIDDSWQVRRWLYEVETLMYAVFHGSNVYSSLHQAYRELTTFGTTSMAVVEDFENVIHARSFTIGEFFLGADHLNRVDTFMRRAEFTARMMLDQFGEDRLSDQVKDALKNNREKTRFTCWQLVLPADPEHEVRDALGRPYVSIWFEETTTKEKGTFLQISGFDELPILTPRYETIADDVYGVGPAFYVLNDCKSAMKLAKKILVAVDKSIDPPVVADAVLKNKSINTMPAGVTFIDDFIEGQPRLQPLYQLNFDLPSANQRLEQLQISIAEGLFSDLFRMLQMQTGTMTATEVAERQQEKLLLLGPFIERAHFELLDPLINRTFNLMARLDLLPEAPPEIEGLDVQVQYVSILAQAQKLAGITAMEQLAAYAGNLSAVDESVLDNFDVDESFREYAERLGTNPRVVVSREQVAEIRQRRAIAMQQQQAMEQAAVMAEGAKVLSETDTGGNNALTALMGGLG